MSERKPTPHHRQGSLPSPGFTNTGPSYRKSLFSQSDLGHYSGPPKTRVSFERFSGNGQIVMVVDRKTKRGWKACSFILIDMDAYVIRDGLDACIKKLEKALP